MLGDQEGSIISQQDVSHGSQPGKPHSRARLRALERTWLRARPSRSALACSRAGNLGGIDGRTRPRTGPAKEASVACTFEDRERLAVAKLRPHITTGLDGHALGKVYPPHARVPLLQVSRRQRRRAGGWCGQIPARRRDHGDHARRRVPHGAETHMPGSTEYKRLEEEYKKRRRPITILAKTALYVAYYNSVTNASRRSGGA